MECGASTLLRMSVIERLVICRGGSTNAPTSARDVRAGFCIRLVFAAIVGTTERVPTVLPATPSILSMSIFPI